MGTRGAVGPYPAPDLQLLVDSTPGLIHTSRPDGYLDFFNQTWLQYVGVSLEHLEGWKWTAYIHPHDVDGIVDVWRASLASGEPFLHEARVLRADGEYRWMLHHKVAVFDEQSHIVKWYRSSIDIEVRKRAENKIREQETELRQILEFTPQLIAALAPTHERLYANCGALDYIGVSLDEWRHASFGKHIHPDDSERLEAYAARALGTGAAFEKSMKPLCLKRSSERPQLWGRCSRASLKSRQVIQRF